MSLGSEMMRKLALTIILSCSLMAGCQEENPRPNNFIDYSLPAYQYLSQSNLSELNGEIEAGLFGDVHSLIIIRNDKIVFENYYGNYSRDELHPLETGTQSVISALVGIMQKNGTLDLDFRIEEFFPEYETLFEDVPQKDKIEIEHLLSHTSGLWWDEWTVPFGSSENDAGSSFFRA